MATGAQCVAEAIARRWSTTMGRLPDDPNYGYNLTDLIGQKLSPTDAAHAQQQAAAEALKDERVKSCTVTLTFTNGALSVSAVGATSAGPFKLVASVSAVGVQLLLVSP
jgi:phage baseplate assembly protein W